MRCALRSPYVSAVLLKVFGVHVEIERSMMSVFVACRLRLAPPPKRTAADRELRD